MGYEADPHYVAGVLEIYGHDGGVLELDGCRVLSQHLGDSRSVELNQHDLHSVGSETLEDAIFRKYDSGGKGYLTKQEVATVMAAIGYEVDAEYIDGLLEISGSEGGVLDLEGFKNLSQVDGFQVLSQHLRDGPAELNQHDLHVVHVGSETLEDAIFRKYDGGGKGYLTKQEVATVMAVLGYEVDAEYIDGLLEISGSEGGVLDLEGFKIISQSLGTGADIATLEDAMFHKYKHDAGGKGYLAAGQVGSLLEDLGYGRVDSEYITGLLEIYGNEEGVLGPDGFKVFSQHLGGEVSEAETYELPALVELPSKMSAPELHLKEEAAPSADSDPKPTEETNTVMTVAAEQTKPTKATALDLPRGNSSKTASQQRLTPAAARPARRGEAAEALGAAEKVQTAKQHRDGALGGTASRTYWRRRLASPPTKLVKAAGSEARIADAIAVADIAVEEAQAAGPAEEAMLEPAQSSDSERSAESGSWSGSEVAPPSVDSDSDSEPTGVRNAAPQKADRHRGGTVPQLAQSLPSWAWGVAVVCLLVAFSGGPELRDRVASMFAVGVAHSWSADNFADCPTDCGNAESVLTRDVTCLGSDGNVAADAAVCPETKLIASLVCSATAVCVKYSWSAVDFDNCPTDCGRDASTTTRDVVCTGSDGKVAPDEASGDCATDPKPEETNACLATAVCTTFHWSVDPFSNCATDCGQPDVVQTRDVVCSTSDGSVASDDALCTEAKPAETSMCPATDVCVTYSWSAVDFAACPTTCGLDTSVLIRDVTCDGSDGNMALDESVCTDAKPDMKLVCAATAVCVTHRWEADASTACPTDCGLEESTLQRAPVCMGSDGNMALDEVCTETMPDTDLVCPATAECVTYSWWF
jgi:Ca2+-binding EF-hand superfamily protein